MSSILHSFLRSNEGDGNGDGNGNDNNSDRNRRSSAPSICHTENMSHSLKTTLNDDIKISSLDIQSLIMNFLVIEGYKEAASHFIQESENIAQSSIYAPMLESMDARQMIKEAILNNGDIPKAISLINDLNPEIMDINPRLSFSLHQQMTMEHHHKGNIDQCLEWAQDELAPRAIENPDLLRELEKTMTSVVFSSPSTSFSPPFSTLLTTGSSSSKLEEELSFSRKQLATLVNNSLLNRKASDIAKDEQVMNCKLPLIIKLLHLLQIRQSSKDDSKDLPMINDYASAL